MKIRQLLPLAALASSMAQAHVALEEPVATAGAGYKAVFRISHGCEGTATHTVVVHLPAGFRGAKPMPKPGWTLSIQTESLAQPYETHGRRVLEDVVRLTWRANSRDAWLSDAHYDEFALRGSAPLQSGPAWFRVQQFCEKGEWDWAEVPKSGVSTKGLKAPAVLLEVVPDHTGHAHH